MSAFGNQINYVKRPDWGALLIGKYRPHFCHLGCRI